MRSEFFFLGRQYRVASQLRRRQLVVIVYVSLALLMCAALAGYANVLLLLAMLVAVRILGGRSYKRGLVPPFWDGDEREMGRRDHAYFLAYWWWDLALIPALLAFTLKDSALRLSWAPAVRALVDHLPYGLLLAAGFLYYTLPQAILLWTEPDMTEEQ